jgi:lipopolysaccharide/colanic/teichoic acid biosynthesis glycosyltransferase
MHDFVVGRGYVEYRANAETCAGLAERTRDPRKRAALLALTRVWLQLADRLESQRALSTVRDAIRGRAVDRATSTTNRAFSLAIKRAFDIVVSAVGLVVLFPTFLLAAIAIKVESCGPVFCVRLTRGQDDRNVSVLNFRTTQAFPLHKIAANPTQVGFFLRERRIDRLPELINVLRGDLSVVGPSLRATDPTDFFAKQIVLIQQQYGVKPGIVSWAQVGAGRGQDTEAQRIERDLHYIENRSLLLDVKIILAALSWRHLYFD